MVIVNNTEAEICSIVSAYVEKEYSWSEGVDKQSVLEQERFFLAEEGIGIHYDVYELGDYAQGAQGFIIPYREFQMKSKNW